MDFCGLAPEGQGATRNDGTPNCGYMLTKQLGYMPFAEFGSIDPSRFGGESLNTKRALRHAGWVTDFNNLNHPSFWRRHPATIQFYYHLAKGSMYHKLPLRRGAHRHRGANAHAMPSAGHVCGAKKKRQNQKSGTWGIASMSFVEDCVYTHDICYIYGPWYTDTVLYA